MLYSVLRRTPSKTHSIVSCLFSFIFSPLKTDPKTIIPLRPLGILNASIQLKKKKHWPKNKQYMHAKTSKKKKNDLVIDYAHFLVLAGVSFLPLHCVQVHLTKVDPTGGILNLLFCSPEKFINASRNIFIFIHTHTNILCSNTNIIGREKKVDNISKESLLYLYYFTFLYLLTIFPLYP